MCHADDDFQLVFGIQRDALGIDRAARDTNILAVQIHVFFAESTAQHTTGARESDVAAVRASAARIDMHPGVAHENRVIHGNIGAVGFRIDSASGGDHRAAALAAVFCCFLALFGQIDARHHNGLTLDIGPDIPDYIVFKTADLFLGQRLTHLQAQRTGLSRGVIHHCLDQRCALQDVTPFGACQQTRALALNHLGVKIIVTQYAHALMRLVTHLLEEIRGAVKLALIDIGQASFVIRLRQCIAARLARLRGELVGRAPEDEAVTQQLLQHGILGDQVILADIGHAIA